MDPQQELFASIRTAIESLGYDVYDGALPPEDTPYPFVYIGESQLVDDMGNKSQILANVYQTVHVWHNNVRRRGDVSSMLFAIKAACRGITDTGIYSWWIRACDQRILSDSTTKTPLLHGVIELEYKLIGGKV
ncbi:MAG: hypothetical protein IJH71_00080 [Eubacterium sp.]|nr:hypothetical protein [Eubacterium sp.]